MSMSVNDATPEEWDAVNKPAHYRVGEVEAIDYIEQQLGSGREGIPARQRAQVSAPPQVQGSAGRGLTQGALVPREADKRGSARRLNG